jgi:transposase
MFQLQELVRLHRMGTSCHERARLLGVSPNTERSYREALEEGGLMGSEAGDLPSEEVLQKLVVKVMGTGQVPPQPSSVAPWLEKIHAWQTEGARPKAIFDRLKREESNFTGSLSAVKRAYFRRRRELGVRAEDVVIPVITAPGQIAQVDFGYVGKLLDPVLGRERKAWVFVMVLAHSRHMYCEIVFDQKVETWLSLHQKAFDWFGGVPDTVVPDNLKSAVIRAAFTPDDTTELNRSYRELARHYSFKVDPAPPYSPEKKGKVESGVNYVKSNFFKSYGQSLDVVELGKRLEQWVLETAGVRDHGTTHKRPLDVFESHEKAHLQALPLVSFETIIWQKVTVGADSHVLYLGARYSVPWCWVKKTGWVRVSRRTIQVHIESVRVATHQLGKSGEHVTLESHLPHGRRDLRIRSRSYWLERGEQIGPDTRAYAQEILDSDDVLCHLRQVQAIVMHLEKFPRHRAEAASRRASFYANYKPQGVKRILARGLDAEPLPLSIPLCQKASSPPRHARNIQQMLEQHIEENHGTN